MIKTLQKCIPLAMSIALAIAAVPHATAGQEPKPGAVDPRIRTVIYNAREVVTITGQLGYQMVIEFGVGEQIENISIGDSMAWQVTPNRKANLLFLKPIDRIPGTNMTVVTNLRHYNFELITVEASPKNRESQIYNVQFLYPNEELNLAQDTKPEDSSTVSDALPPESWNFAYSYSGSKSNVPERVFDDGRFTFFQWTAQNAAPAVFVLNDDGKEMLVNHTMRGRYFVVEQVAATFVLRNGKQVTNVFNDTFKTPEPGAAAPREREKKRGWFGSSKR